MNLFQYAKDFGQNLFDSTVFSVPFDMERRRKLLAERQAQAAQIQPESVTPAQYGVPINAMSGNWSGLDAPVQTAPEQHTGMAGVSAIQAALARAEIMRNGGGKNAWDIIKPGDPYTLGPTDTRFGADNREVSRGHPAPYTLTGPTGSGEVRYNGQDTPVAGFTSEATTVPGLRGPPPGAPLIGQTPNTPSDRDMDALARMIFTEAGGEGPQGMAAVAHVAVNRLKSGYRGAKTLADVVGAPHQFEGMTSRRAQVAPTDPGYQQALQIAQGVVSGQIPDPTHGAVNFLNPELQAKLGRQQPDWAPGNGLRLGNHVFYGGGNPGGNAGAPYQVAANGPTPPPPGPRNPSFVTAPKIGQAGHASTPQELAAVGLPAGTRAWTDATGHPQPYPDAYQPAPAGSDLSGEDFLKTLPQGYAAQLRAYANGDLSLPGGNRAGSRQQQKLLNDIFQFDPTASAANLVSRSATRKDLATGKMGQNVTALNTALGHADALDTSIDEMGNQGWPINNWAAHGIADFTGTGTRLADFRSNKKAFTDEVVRVFRQTGGSEQDIQAQLKLLDEAQTPAYLHKVVGAIVQLLDSRLDAVGTQYNRGMGRTTDPIHLLAPHAAAVMQRLFPGRVNYGEEPGPAGPTLAAPGTAPNVGAPRTGPPRIRTYNPQTGRLE